MKRITAIILAILMLVCFAACGDSNDDTDAQVSTSNAAVLGREAYDEVIAKNDLTLVNIWATWCTPCVNELSELQRIEDEYKNVAVVGILFDGVNSSTLARDEITIEYAVELMEDKGVSYTVVVPDEHLFNTFCADLMYFPTSYFVDSEGNIVGEQIIGANSFESWSAYVDAALGE